MFGVVDNHRLEEKSEMFQEMVQKLDGGRNTVGDNACENRPLETRDTKLDMES